MIHPLYEAHQDDEPVELAESFDDPMIARSLLIELQINERKADQLRATLAAVEGEYKARIQKLADREAEVRRSLTNYVQVNGKVSFPDVGGCSVSQRGPQAKVADPDAFAAWLTADSQFRELVTVEQTYRFDNLAKRAALETLDATGEVPPGVEIVTPEPSLTVRKA